MSLDLDRELDAVMPSIAASFHAFSARQMAAGRISGDEKGRLRTAHQTVLVFNGETDLLEHRVLTSMMLGADVTPVWVDRTSAGLVLRSSLHGWINRISADGRPTFSQLPPDAAQEELEILELRREVPCLAFKVAGKYMCAETDGSIVVNRPKCGVWEVFYEIDPR